MLLALVMLVLPLIQIIKINMIDVKLNLIEFCEGLWLMLHKKGDRNVISFNHDAIIWKNCI